MICPWPACLAVDWLGRCSRSPMTSTAWISLGRRGDPSRRGNLPSIREADQRTCWTRPSSSGPTRAVVAPSSSSRFSSVGYPQARNAAGFGRSPRFLRRRYGCAAFLGSLPAGPCGVRRRQSHRSAVRRKWPAVPLHLCGQHLDENATSSLKCDGRRGMSNKYRELLNAGAHTQAGWVRFGDAVPVAGRPETNTWVSLWDAQLTAHATWRAGIPGHYPHRSTRPADRGHPPVPATAPMDVSSPDPDEQLRAVLPGRSVG
jgi:hypothetical protein